MTVTINGTGPGNWDSSGNLGVGTASPVSTSGTYAVLQINGTSAGGQLHLTGGGSGAAAADGSAITQVGSDLYIHNQETGITYFYNNSVSTAQINSSGVFAFNSGYGSAATAYGCRAWVSFAGATGTRTGSGNVSSVTRNSTGNYTVNFATAMVDATYSAVCTTRNGSIAGFSQGTLTTTAFTFLTSNTSGTATDSTDNGVAVFR